MKHHTTLTISLCCFLAFVSHAIAQTPTPTAAKPPSQMPDMSAMYSQMMSAMFTELTRPERATQLAKFQRQYYEALIKEGFTKEESLNIVKATQLPFAGTK